MVATKAKKLSDMLCCPTLYQVPQDVDDPDNHPTEPGWYWELDGKVHGPFTTRKATLQDMYKPRARQA